MSDLACDYREKMVRFLKRDCDWHSWVSVYDSVLNGNVSGDGLKRCFCSINDLVADGLVLRKWMDVSRSTRRSGRVGVMQDYYRIAN